MTSLYPPDTFTASHGLSRCFARWTVYVVEDLPAGRWRVSSDPDAHTVQASGPDGTLLAIATRGSGELQLRSGEHVAVVTPYGATGRGEASALQPSGPLLSVLNAIRSADESDDDLQHAFAEVLRKAADADASYIDIGDGWAVVCIAGAPPAGGDYARPIRCRITLVTPDDVGCTSDTGAMRVVSEAGRSIIALVRLPERVSGGVLFYEADDGAEPVAARMVQRDIPSEGASAYQMVASLVQEGDPRYAVRFLVRSAVEAGASAAAVTLRLDAPPLRAAVTEPHRSFGFSVDELITFPGRGYAVLGWRWDPEGLIDQVEVVPPMGPALPLSFEQCAFERKDVLEQYTVADASGVGNRPGYLAFVEDRDAVESHVVDVVVRLRGGASYTMIAEQPVMNAAEKRDRLLRACSASDVIAIEALAPAFDAAQAGVIALKRVTAVHEFNGRAGPARFSLVVPLYRRYDFVRHQLAQFVNDPDFDDVEVVYVLDSPEQERDFVELMRFWTELWRIRVRAVVLAKNVGYAAATNVGVAHAQGEIVVLLNSDVFPSEAGWLTTMAHSLDQVDGVGIVGPRLLYEDETLQHAGMYYAPAPKGLWSNHHYFKGYPAGFPGANVPRYVDAVTGACLMLHRDLYGVVAGLAEDYCVGDFEDSDFCNRVAATGLRIWYEPRATLYHLERQSFPISAYTPVAWRYNQWLHERRWRRRLTDGIAPIAIGR